MKNLFGVLIMFLCLSSCKKSEFQEETSESIIYSSIIDDEFKIYSYLPPDYDISKEYPVIFILDGNWYFNKFSKELNDLIQGGEIESSILIGIGYTKNVDKKRQRDYAFPNDPAYEIDNGEADNFYIFLKDELIPLIESEYSTDASQYILMGHSLGGYNTLFNMLQVDSPFNGYVAVSSSLWWNDDYLFGLEDQFFQNTNDLPAQVYITFGSEEPLIALLNEEFAERLKERNYNNFNLAFQMFSGASHSQTNMKGFSDGVQFILNY